MATCTEDGRVFIIDPLASSYKEIQSIMFNDQRDSAVSVSLSPQYATMKRVALAYEGSGNLVISEKSFTKNKITLLNSNQRASSLIRWSPSDPTDSNFPGFIAFISNNQCFIYSYAEKNVVFELNRSSGRISVTLEEERPNVSNCSLLWENPYRLLIVWGDVLQAIDVAVLGYYGATILGQNNKPKLECKISASFRVAEYSLLSASSYKTYFVILAWSKITNNIQILLTRRNGDIVSIKTLSNIDLPDQGLSELDLVCPSKDQTLFFIRSPNQILCFEIKDVDAVIDSLLVDSRVADATYKAIRHKEALTRHDVLNLMDAYLSYLFKNEDFVNAATFCWKHLKRNKERWIFWTIFQSKSLNSKNLFTQTYYYI
jgi:hypothetical protein